MSRETDLGRFVPTSRFHSGDSEEFVTAPGALQRSGAQSRSRATWTPVCQFALFCALFLGVLTLISRPAFAASPQDVPKTDLFCLLSPEAQGVVVLFSGKAEELTQNFTHPDGAAPTWTLTDDGALKAQTADLMTKQLFDDCQIHIEFKIPHLPNATGQARGNSGVILHGRFELQILDSSDVSLPGVGDCGAIFNQHAPLVNACKAPEEWQSYDIIFRAAHYSEDNATRLESSSITAFLNGVLVQNNTTIPIHTDGYTIGDPKKPSPFLLQYNGSAVEFRNIWVLPLSRTPVAAPDAAQPAPARSSEVFAWKDVKQGEEVPVEQVFFDGGGYQVVCATGDTIVVPFANENLNAMKFGRSTTGNAYFVQDGTTPILYLSDKGYLQNAAIQDVRWYPLTPDYVYSSPIYVDLAPTWRDYTTMGWYPGMVVYGGAIPSTRGVSYTWMPGYYTSIAGTSYPSYLTYRSYMTRHLTYARTPMIYKNYQARSTSSWDARRLKGGPVRSGDRTSAPGLPRVRPGYTPYRPGLPPGRRNVPPRTTAPGGSTGHGGPVHHAPGRVNTGRAPVTSHPRSSPPARRSPKKK